MVQLQIYGAAGSLMTVHDCVLLQWSEMVAGARGSFVVVSGFHG